MKPFFAWSQAEHGERNAAEGDASDGDADAEHQFAAELDAVAEILIDCIALGGGLVEARRLATSVPAQVAGLLDASLDAVAATYHRQTDEIAAAAAKAIEPLFASMVRGKAIDDFVEALNKLIRTKSDELVTIEVPELMRSTVKEALQKQGLQANLKVTGRSEARCIVGDTVLETRTADGDSKLSSAV